MPFLLAIKRKRRVTCSGTPGEVLTAWPVDQDELNLNCYELNPGAPGVGAVESFYVADSGGIDFKLLTQGINTSEDTYGGLRAGKPADSTALPPFTSNNYSLWLGFYVESIITWPYVARQDSTTTGMNMFIGGSPAKAYARAHNASGNEQVSTPSVPTGQWLTAVLRFTEGNKLSMVSSFAPYAQEFFVMDADSGGVGYGMDSGSGRILLKWGMVLNTAYSTAETEAIVLEPWQYIRRKP